MYYKKVISLYPQVSGIKSYQSVSTPPHPRKGDIWVYSVSGEEAVWYVDSSGNAAFVEFADGAVWNSLPSVSTALTLPSNPVNSQILIHGNRKWQWNGKFWKSMYPVVGVRGGTFSD
jgi:hypothetical protein